MQKQRAFVVGENETPAAAVLEREVRDGIDYLLEDVSADPQFSERPGLVTEKRRRDDVVPQRVSGVGLDRAGLVCFLRSLFVRRLLDRLEKARSWAGGYWGGGCWCGGGSGGCVCCVHLVLKRVPDGYIVHQKLEKFLRRL